MKNKQKTQIPLPPLDESNSPENAPDSDQNAGSARPERPERFYVMPGGWCVPRCFVDRLTEVIVARAPQLVRGREYTVRKICGDIFWASLSKGQRLDAGRCGTHLARAGEVPLTDTEKKTSANAHLYLVK